MKLPYRGILSVLALIAAALLLPHSRPFAQSSGSYASPTPGYGGTPTPAYNGSSSSTTTYIPTGPAASMQAPNEVQYVTFQVPVGRGGHSFSMIQLDAAGVQHGRPTVVKGIATVTGTNGSQVASYLSVVGTLLSPAGGDWWLSDTTAQQAWPRNVRGLVNSTMQSGTGSYYRYFAVPVSRSGHMLMVGSTASGWMPLTQGPMLALVTTDQSGTAQSVSEQLFEAYAQVFGNFNVVDRTDGKSAPLNQTNLADSLWTVDLNSYPLRTVSLILEGIEDGHWFNLSSKAPEGPVMQARVQAHAGAWGGSVTVQNGGTMQVPANSASITTMVGAGMEFWITREADGRSSIESVGSTFVAPASATYGSGSSSGTAFYSLFGNFPASPGRVLETRTFRVHWANRATHSFTVWRGDGYHTHVTPPYSPDIVRSWDDSGNEAVNPLDVAVFTADIDPDLSRTWWLRDDTNGQTFPLWQVDVFDGWQPQHTEPPPYPILTVDLFAGREFDSFTLDWHGVQSAPFLPDVMSRDTLQYQNEAGEFLYELPFVTLTLTDPHPYASGSIILTDTTTNESRSLQSKRDPTDLIDWLFLPRPVNLSISSSRWNHNLVLNHPNGEQWPVEQNLTAGETTSGPTFQSWQNSYYYFYATVQRRMGLDWWLEDLSTGETTIANPSHDDLIAWNFIAAPASLTGGITSDCAVTIQWPRGSSSVNGAFEIERRCDSGPWLFWGKVQPSATNPLPTATFTDELALFGSAYHYRVRSVFGPAKSAPSPELYIGGMLDSDDDGLTDAEELAIAANPLLGPDVQVDSDRDGVSDAQEIINGTDPNDIYNAVPPQLHTVSGSGQTGLPNRFYPDPLVLKVAKVTTTTGGATVEVPMVEAPVSVQAGPGGGRVAQGNDGTGIRDSLTMITDKHGEARFYLEAPVANGQQFFIAKAGGTTLQVPVNVNYSIGPPAPQNITSEWIGNGTRLSWDPLASPPGSLEVERSLDRKIWKVVKKLPGDAVSYEDHYVSVAPVVYYRITSLPTPP